MKILFQLRMTVTITITMTGLEAVRIPDERGTRKHLNADLQRIDHKKRTSLPIQYDFPYRYVFPANHPYSSYAPFLGLPPAATPQYNNAGGGSPGYELYAPGPPAAPQFVPSLYQHQHMHQHQHQLQLQQPLGLPQPQPPQPPLPLPPQNAQAEFKYTMKPSSSNGHHHTQHTASSNNVHMGPFQSGSAPTVLLLHATNPAGGSVQTFLLIPASTTDGGQSFGVGPSVSPNLLNAIAGAFPLRGASGVGGATLSGVSQAPMVGSLPTAHSAAPMASPMMLRPGDHTKIANSHFLNQLSAAQLMSRPVNGGVYQLPLMPTNAKYYKRKKSSIEAKMSQADSHAMESSGDHQSTSTDRSASEIRNGHAPRIPDQEETSSDTFEDYVPENEPLTPSKRS